ncbi:MAG TPA: DSD1 family PLP-dependent enzyme [Emcibacteraceae bacterium]|nr:DSD1 family PLP-dependent enzyme [Emcibacteraceae bacterium]HRW30211.1 DSD1 family PLP-dependent enzyme [Emcibacteraceae bacterium]
MMVQRPPAEIGMTIDEIDTPALVVDLDIYERNLDKMAKLVHDAGKKLRPHAKMHKSPDVAHDQITRGAVGVCCQKISEAEIMVEGGINDVLITNEIVSPAKLARVARLAKQAKIGICVDDAGATRALNDACAREDAHVRVLIEIDVGGHRCGVTSPAEALALAKLIKSLSHLNFGGLQAYHGSAQHKRTAQERSDAVSGAADIIRETRQLLEASGIGCDIVTGGGTGTLMHDINYPEWGELQCGSYAFMDADYAKNRLNDDQFGTGFEHAFFVRTVIMSICQPEIVVADAGLKAIASDSGNPTIVGHEHLTYRMTSDEHGCITVSGTERFELGEKLMLITGHCDPTINLYDWIVGIRNGKVEKLWPVAARGALS